MAALDRDLEEWQTLQVNVTLGEWQTQEVNVTRGEGHPRAQALFVLLFPTVLFFILIFTHLVLVND